MNASRGRTRGTRRDWYSRKPSKRSFTAGMRLCERRKIRSYRMASVWPVTNAPVPAPACRKLTIDRRHATPARMPARFQDSRADEAQRGRFVLPLEHRVQHDGGADAGKGHDHLQDAADEDAEYPGQGR